MSMMIQSGRFGAAAPPADLDLTFTTGTLDPRITFSRASIGTCFDVAGVLQTAASGAPRFDYHPVTHAELGLLIEEARTNVISPSQDFSSANYTKTGATVTVDQIAAPDGTTTADRITSSAGTATVTYNLSVSSTVVYVQSIFIKAGTCSWAYMRGQSTDAPMIWFNLTTGAKGTEQAGFTSTAIQDVGGGWYRCSLIDVGATGAEPLFVGLSDADNSTTVTVGRTIHLWGAHHETSVTSLSTYIPTTSSAVTRAVDVATMTGTNFSSWYTAAAGTFVTEFDLFTTTGTRGIMSADNNTTAEVIRLYGSGTDPKVTITDNSATQADLDVGTIAAGTICKLGVSFAANDIAACLNGGTVGTDTTATLPAPTQLRIGVNSATAANTLNGHLRRIRFYNTNKSDADLQALTT